MEIKRSSGILLHVSSLPGRFGIGDLGSGAYRFIDWLHAAGQSWWQVLPLGPVGGEASPYSAVSSWAGAPLFLSLEELVKAGDLSPAQITPKKETARVDFGKLQKERMPLIRLAALRFINSGKPSARDAFEGFCRRHALWLDDWALYAALKLYFADVPWYKWPVDLRARKRNAMAEARKTFRHELLVQKYFQFRFFEQWQALRNYAVEKGVRIIGDLPIYCAHDSADVWASQELFLLGKDGQPRKVSGVPPDAFNKNGQLWGHPIYNWKRHEAEGFSWWIRRLEAALALADVVRIDHFRGFAGYYEVPFPAKNARSGRWMKAPGKKLFEKARKVLGDAPFFAEDLGRITPDVIELRDGLKLPGMRVLQFAFGGNPGNPHREYNHVRNSVVYSGTHDNDTALGWYRTLPAAQKELFNRVTEANARNAHTKLMRLAFDSVADLAVVPMQDVLGLGSSARMNFPGCAEGWWRWKLVRAQLRGKEAAMLRELTSAFGRMNRE